MWVMVILLMDMSLVMYIHNKFCHLGMDIWDETSNIEISDGYWIERTYSGVIGTDSCQVNARVSGR